MAFSSTKDMDVAVGSMRLTGGTFTNTGGGTGGAIPTGLQRIYMMKLQHVAAAVVARAPAFTITNVDPVTITTVANTGGIWMAWGV